MTLNYYNDVEHTVVWTILNGDVSFTANPIGSNVMTIRCGKDFDGAMIKAVGTDIWGGTCSYQTQILKCEKPKFDVTKPEQLDKPMVSKL